MSNRTSIPRPARAWTIAIFGAMTAFLAWTAIARGGVVPWVLFIGFTLLAFTALLRALSTALTLDGVSQLTLQGRVSLKWSEVQRVEIGARGRVQAVGPTATVVISPIFFENFDATLAWLHERLVAVWPAED